MNFFFKTIFGIIDNDIAKQMKRKMILNAELVYKVNYI